jgi:diguanylate cyclase (GGDEF)-like protein
MDELPSDEDELQARNAGHDLALSLAGLAVDALELILVVWELEDNLVCFSSRWAKRAHGADHLTYLDAMEVRALIHPNDHAELDAMIDRCLDGTGSIVNAGFRIRMPSGWLPVSARCRAMAFDEGGRVTRIVAMLTEIREFDAIRKLQRRDQRDSLSMALPNAYNVPAKVEPIGRDMAFSDYLEWHGRVMKMVLQGDDLQPVLDDIAQMVERCVADATCSVLLLNEAGDRFSRVAAPSFAPAFHRALLRLTVEPETGTCGAAVSRRVPVFTADIAGSPLWKSLQELASAHDLASCFSWPIFGQSGRILGTIAMYFQEVRAPGDTELRIMPSFADLAAVAITRQESEARIRNLSDYDGLTGLPNRARFHQLLEAELLQAGRRRQAAGLLFIDLDRFKIANDRLGQQAGDTVLRQTAHRLRQAVGKADDVARLGADEFAVLVRNPSSLESLKSLADGLLVSLAQPVQVGRREFRSTVSIGLCRFPDDGTDAHVLMRSADLAMCQAKVQGGNAVCHYAVEMVAASVGRLELQADLRGAAARNELVLMYQPKLHLATGRLTGVEALIRWQHPRHGLLPPANFISLAESSGDILEIGRWVIHAVCRQLAAWREAGQALLPVAINLSPRQFAGGNLASEIDASLKRHDLPASLLELEITESLVVKDPALATEILAALRRIGLSISMDDFGTGYSSLAQLKRFPLDSVKIDRSFVQDIPHDANDTAIIKAIIAMGHALKLKVIAEGVENAEQLAFLHLHGCDEMQGFYFSRPMTADQLSEFTEAYKEKSLTLGPA